MNAAVIVLSWNGANVLPACLQALGAQDGGQPDLLVVDNGSVDGSAALVRELSPACRLIENGRNLGFAGGMNVGLRALLARSAPPDIVVLLNQDTIVATDWLRQITAPFATDERIAAAGCKIHYPDGETLQHAGAYLQLPRALNYHIGQHERDIGQYDLPRDMEQVTGAAIALRVAALREVGLFDEGYIPAYYEDVDLCWRLRRAGYRVYYAPAATLRHAESGSTSGQDRRSALLNRNRLRFVIKTFPSEAIWNDFVIAERLYISLVAGTVPSENRALRWAYLEGLLNHDEWCRARAQLYEVTAAERARFAKLCDVLRRDLAAFDRAHRRWWQQYTAATYGWAQGSTQGSSRQDDKMTR
jgi:GT2 family glycosyltransferase